MSTVVPQSSPRPGMPGWLKWLLGCCIVLFLLVFACCLGTCLAGKTLFGGAIEAVTQAETERGLEQAASARVAALDLDSVPVLPADVAEAALTPADIERYMRVRQAVAAAAAEYQAAADGAIPVVTGPLSLVRGMTGLVAGAVEATVARRKVLEAAEIALRAEGMGPTDFARMTEIVEWRFLRRDRAAFLGLPEDEGRRLVQMRFEIRLLEAFANATLPGSWSIDNRSRSEVVADLDRLRANVAALEATARGRTQLAEPTLAVLEAARPQLETLDPAGLDVLARLTSEPPLAAVLGSGGHVNLGGHWPPHDAPSHAGEPAPENAGTEPDAPEQPQAESSPE